MNTNNEALSGAIVALDTSTAAMAAAVMRGGEVLGEVQSVAERNHSVHVITHLKALLAAAEVRPEQLDAIVVGRGPGSYTGMRIAVTAAKTLAWVWEKPLVGVSSLEAIAYGAWRRGMEQASSAGGVRHWVLPMMDARRGQVYTAGFAGGERAGDWTRWAEDGVRLMAEWVELVAGRLREARSRGERIAVWLAGDLTQHGASVERLRELGAAAGAEVRAEPYMLEGRFVAELGAKRLALGESDETHTFIPNYTQLTEAEVKLRQRQSGEGQA